MYKFAEFKFSRFFILQKRVYFASIKSLSTNSRLREQFTRYKINIETNFKSNLIY